MLLSTSWWMVGTAEYQSGAGLAPEPDAASPAAFPAAAFPAASAAASPAACMFGCVSPALFSSSAGRSHSKNRLGSNLWGRADGSEGVEGGGVR